jgi:DNA-binding transcriptional regulator GbsR (MarR family)
MPNIEDMEKASRQHFVEDLARLLAPWGLPQTAARLYGHLLLAAEPLSLDCIATDLEISKSTASVAARMLEMSRLARRHGQRGSRRVLFEASDDFEGILNEQIRLTRALAKLLTSGARIAQPGPVCNRLKVMAEFNLTTIEAQETALKHWTARSRRRTYATASR